MPVLYSIGSIESARSTLIHEPDFPKTLLLDTNVLIDVARGSLIEVPEETSVIVSSLSLVKLAAPNHMDVKVANEILNVIGIEDVISVTREVATLATELRKVQSLSVIDACIAATACLNDAVLVTNDGQLIRHPVVTTSPFPFHFNTEADQQ
jgi:predicted nucleic acid-binding protein